MRENVYQIIKQTKRSKKDFRTFDVGEGYEAFCYWDGESRYKTNVGRNGLRKLTFICEKCINDPCAGVQQVVLDLKLHTDTHRLNKNMWPCGCAKQRGKTLLQHHGVDDFIGVTKEFENNTLKIEECLGGKGNKRKYIVTCSVCSKDKELWPYGSIVTTKSNFQQRDHPNCGCNPHKTLRSEGQNYILAKRKAESKGLLFEGWTNGKYKGTNGSRVILNCKYHGISDNTRLDKFLMGEGGCKDCAQELGSFGYYKGRLDEKDHLYLLKCDNTDEQFYKIGRSFNVSRRVRQHKQHSPYNFVTISVVENTHKFIFELEKSLLLETSQFWYTPNHLWDGGYRECRSVEILQHPEIIKTFNLST